LPCSGFKGGAADPYERGARNRAATCATCALPVHAGPAAESRPNTWNVVYFLTTSHKGYCHVLRVCDGIDAAQPSRSRPGWWVDTVPEQRGRRAGRAGQRQEEVTTSDAHRLGRGVFPPATGGSPSSRRRHPARATINHSLAASWAPAPRRRLRCRPMPRARLRSPALRMWASQGDPDSEGPRIPPGVGDDLAGGARRHRHPGRPRRCVWMLLPRSLAGRLEARGDPRGHLRGRRAISRDPPGIRVAACPGSTPGSSGARRARDRDRARRVQRIRSHAVRASPGAPDLATSAPPGYRAGRGDLQAEQVVGDKRARHVAAFAQMAQAETRASDFRRSNSATSSRHR